VRDGEDGEDEQHGDLRVRGEGLQRVDVLGGDAGAGGDPHGVQEGLM
jgi:hypothetical protein